MKSLFLSLLSAAFFCVACTNDTEKPAASADSATPAEPGPSANPDYQKGLALVAKSDCLTCHRINEKLIGPSYSEVAAKYPSTPENITNLAHRIIEGVTAEKAIWGTAPMTSHPQLSQQDAEQMVKYVLLLKK